MLSLRSLGQVVRRDQARPHGVPWVWAALGGSLPPNSVAANIPTFTEGQRGYSAGRGDAWPSRAYAPPTPSESHLGFSPLLMMPCSAPRRSLCTP